MWFLFGSGCGLGLRLFFVLYGGELAGTKRLPPSAIDDGNPWKNWFGAGWESRHTLRLELDAARKLDRSAVVARVRSDLSEAPVADCRAGHTEEGVVGDVVHLGPEVEPGRLR